MEQIMTYEVLLQVAKESSHGRDIAKKISVNHMTVSRALIALMNDNAVDYRDEGRNKVYFIKKSLEGKNLLIMAEMYKLNKCIEKYPRIRKIVDLMQKNRKVKLAVLFGSYAKLTAKENSDIDVYIDTNDAALKRELSLTDSSLSIKTGMFDMNNLLVKEIMKNHVIIKGAEEYYGKTGFFS